MKKNITSATAAASLFALASLPINAATIDSRNKPFNEYSWITTHNSYEKINQNLKEMPQQLKDGVRGFMLDLYPNTSNPRPEERVRVCHTTNFCYGPLSAQLKNEFLPFLRANPKEVVTLFLETYVSRDDLQTVFNTLPELADVSFNPGNFAAGRWPTLSEMANNNNRLIMMTDKRDIGGEYKVNGKTITVLFDQDWIVQNHWSTLGLLASSLEKQHNWSCPTRWGNKPIAIQSATSKNWKQWKPLFLMNQFHHGSSTTLDSAAYDNNLTYLMRRVDNCGVTPNFIGVNNYKSGEADRYTNALNNGGIYFYEDVNANKAQDAVCVIPATHGVVNLKANGCENDEAKSLTLSGVAKGTRITLFDSPSGNKQDDHLIIDVKRDIGIQEHVLLPNFESHHNNEHYQAVYNRNNGLNGKLSRINIGGTPTGFADSSVAFYEGGNASQNLDCVIPFAHGYNLKMKNNAFGCSNDEIRSAVIVKAKAGSSFTLTGHPDGDFNQGRTEVKILRNITLPVTIPSFDRNYKSDTVEVIHHGNAIDGKISFGYIGGKQ
ncbi:PI-PLC domain-containing protein [Pseudomonas huanghezhanensis]|uniref:hypothetical protein n=1 Tax=Pseudomonas huanghezhanensis TaxID=3002903 RepID=UPI002285CA79|nr:hypothetical protein [Pseudomonas sp. BSw22131]